MSNFFMKYEVIKPYLINNSPPHPDSERLQSNEDTEKLFESAKCILCTCCTTSCTSTWTNENYLGPAAMLRAYRFINDTRDEGLMKDSIFWISCRQLEMSYYFNCVESCPKEIDITWHLSKRKEDFCEGDVIGDGV